MYSCNKTLLREKSRVCKCIHIFIFNFRFSSRSLCGSSDVPSENERKKHAAKECGKEQTHAFGITVVEKFRRLNKKPRRVMCNICRRKLKIHILLYKQKSMHTILSKISQQQVTEK